MGQALNTTSRRQLRHREVSWEGSPMTKSWPDGQKAHLRRDGRGESAIHDEACGAKRPLRICDRRTRKAGVFTPGGLDRFPRNRCVRLAAADVVARTTVVERRSLMVEESAEVIVGAGE